MYFVDSANGIYDITHAPDFCKDSSIFFALTPEAQSVLKSKKLKYDNSVCFFGSDGHISVSNRSSKIIKIARKLWKFKDDAAIEYAYENTLIFYFRFYLHYCLLNVYIFSQVVKQYKPKTVYISCIFSNNLFQKPL